MSIADTIAYIDCCGKAEAIHRAMSTTARHVCCPMTQTHQLQIHCLLVFAVHSMGKLQTADLPEHIVRSNHAGTAAHVFESTQMLEG